MLVTQVAPLRHRSDLFDEDAEVHTSLLFVVHLNVLFLFVKRDYADLGEQLDRLNASAWRANQVSKNLLDEVCLEHVA